MISTPNSAQLMALTLGANGVRNGNSERETFHKFFECWLAEQNHKLQELISVSKDHHRHQQRRRQSDEPTDDVNVNDGDGDHHHQHLQGDSLLQGVTEAGSSGGGDEDGDNRELRQMINGVIEHYELYYSVKSQWAKQDVLTMLTPPWRSTLEDAFLWIGGWRPSMVFHLLYSKAGLQLEAQLAELIRGLTTGDLADLSAAQLRQINEVQTNTISEEKEISEAMARHQETVADASMVELSHVITEIIHQNNGHSNNGGSGEMQAMVDSVLAPKEERLEEVLAKADDLRLRTLKAVMEILNPIQAVHYLIAAAELHLRIHDWGKKRDAMQHNQVGTNGHSH